MTRHVLGQIQTNKPLKKLPFPYPFPSSLVEIPQVLTLESIVRWPNVVPRLDTARLASHPTLRLMPLQRPPPPPLGLLL